jgi:AraC-like DNA-binding protein
MALSRRQLTRRLKGAVGEPPGQVLRQLRIERGKQLLEEGVETVSEVAYATGFRSPSAFSHAFGEVVGQTPTAYADEHCG